jgi:hypothetical protein
MGGKRVVVGVALALLAFPPAGVAQARQRADRTEWQNRLGRQGVVDLDRRTGTPRVLARLDGTLTRASKRSPEEIATAYVRANLATLGLTAADVEGTPATTSLPGGVTAVQWRQSVDGIPAADNALRVNVGRDGRVLSLAGSPAHDLAVNASTPALDAGRAVRAVQDDVGVHRALVRRGGPAGVRRATFYGDDTSASLVATEGRLAWRVQYRASGDAVYDATVDARTGRVLRRVNMVVRDTPALVWERFPGNGPGGTAATVDLQASGWLTATQGNLDGPNVHVYSDLDDSDTAAASEEILRTGGEFAFPLQPVAAPGCDAAHLCAWSSSADRTLNRNQDAVQAFYFANRFHDHLATLGFTAAAGAFEGDDALLLETMDGAATGPDGTHLNNANMFTPPDGSRPRMQMYLWSSPFRRISSGSDAAVLYHEYTHGLSSRLVTDADGIGALNSPQAGAMGEAWSDFYAMDFIVDQFPSLDTGAVGEVTMGAYTDLPGASSKLRFSPLDCPPAGADPVACPGRPVLGSGGFTYGDFGRIAGGAEVHADGEIWAQTLWDIRTALGPAKARALVTTGMGLLAPEPSFLDARNAILVADQTLYGGADTTALWTVFAGRGMGFFAASLNGDDTSPAQSFALPPAADTPRGTITGRVTDALDGAGVAGVTVGLAGGLSTVSAVTGADGRYTIADVPAGTYLKVVAGGSGWEGPTTSLALAGDTTLTYDAVVKRDWAAAKGGATITESNGREYAEYGCGPNAAIDQSRLTGWSTQAGSAKSMTVRLPAAVDLTQIGIDPTETCGDSSSAATGGYRVETSPDGTTWTTAASGAFAFGDRRRLNLLTPVAGARGVRFARLTLLSSQGAGAQYRDLSEFALYGSPADTTAPAAGPSITSLSGPPDSTNVATPQITFTAAGNGATFECRLTAPGIPGDFEPCTPGQTFGPLAEARWTFTVRARDGAGTVGPEASLSFTVDVTPPPKPSISGPSSPVHAGPLGLSVSAGEGEVTCALDDAAYGSCATTILAETLAPGEHIVRARSQDAAGNVGEEAEYRFTVVNAAPTATLDVDLETGPAPLDTRPAIAGSDPDGDPLTYRLDFGDGQVATGALPVAPAGHRYEAAGVYTLRLTVSDGRASRGAQRDVVVTTPRAETPPPLTLVLSAARVELGPFIPGLARDYGASLTATTTGGGTLTVADRGANPGHLAGPAGALAQPLRVRSAGGAFAPLTSPVTVPDSVEFKQPIAADEVLRPGAYTKALTFTLAVTTP